MITNVFEYYYTTDVYPVRLKPLSRDELLEGLPTDVVDKYLFLVEQLYLAFFYDVNAEFVPLSEDEHRQNWITRQNLYNDIIRLLFKHDAISDDVFCEFHKTMPIEFNYLELPGLSRKYIGDSLDDFRLAFELGLVECDENINLIQSYLYACYNYLVCGRPNAQTDVLRSADLRVIRYVGTHPDGHIVEASYWEVRHLLENVRRDMKRNADEQNLIDDVLCRQNGDKLNAVDTFRKTTYGLPRNVAEWYTTKRALEREADYLWRIEDEISRIFDTLEKPDDGVGFGATLYIYKGKLLCHRREHPLVPATAIIHDDRGRAVELDVEYCPTCKRYMLNYTSYEQYRKRHGLLIGKLKMISGDGAGNEVVMASESPLKLCGYNVSQAEGLSAATRQFLLAKIIHDEIMSKIDVIHYLEHFINMNGAKKENFLAHKKWCEDLDFVHKYNKETQPKVYIEKITSF